MKLLVIGRSGQVARGLIAAGCSHALGRDALDLSAPQSISAILKREAPDAIINAAAYTQVDLAEQERAVAFAVNAEAPAVMAQYCAQAGIPLVHYSTDYVFDGSGDEPRTEDATTAPLNIYGESKLAGEQAITDSGCNHLILRTSWVYDAEGKNFFNTMLRLGAEREELRIVADQVGAPSYAPQLAQYTLIALSRAMEVQQFPSGVYHFTHQGAVSWHGFAEAIFQQAQQRRMQLKVERVLPIASAEYPTPAARPHNSRLDGGKLARIFGLALPHWRDGLDACFGVKHGNL